MKKILIITPFVPSNIGAGVNYTRLFIEDLSKENEVDVVLFKSKNEEQYNISNTNVKLIKEFRICTFYKFLNCALCFFLFPLFTAKFSIKVLIYLRKTIRKKKYDIVYFDFSQMFLYAKFLKHYNKILMAHDIITQRYSRYNNMCVTKFCFITENWILHTKHSRIFTFSRKDSNLIHSYFELPSTPTSFYLSRNIINSLPDKLEDYFVFFAMWKRIDNYKGLEWFLKKVLPLIDGEIKLKIIGLGLNVNLIKFIEKKYNIEYLGFVDNPYPIIANAKALISPLFTGAGVKVKVIDALACGTPVIGTDISFEGIDEDFSSFMLLANTPEEFVHKIKTVDITLEDKLNFRKKFISCYSNKSVIRYINSK